MNPLKVTNIQRGCVNDGPGVRTTVFFKGCPLRCPWCCNPETQSLNQEYFIDYNKCILDKGINSPLCKDCERNSGKVSINSCKFGVSTPVYKEYEVDDLFNEIIKDKSLFDDSKGGATFSGGEPLLSAESMVPLMAKLQNARINIAIETTLTVKDGLLDFALPYVNLYIVDLKLQPEMKLGKLQYVNEIKRKLGKIKKNVIFRLVVTPSCIDRQEEITNTLYNLGISKIELLKCHNLGENKYRKLKKISEDYSTDTDDFISFGESLKSNGISTTLLQA